MPWEDLSKQENTALRHLVKGQVHDVPWRLILCLQKLGLVDDSQESRLAASPRQESSCMRRDRNEPAAGSNRRRCAPNQPHVQLNVVSAIPKTIHGVVTL